MSQAIDHVHFRHVMGQVPTCVTVITAMVDEEPVAMVIGSFVSVSLEPPLAGFFCTTTSGTWQQLRRAEVLGVNVLSAGQAAISNDFMRAAEQRFDGIDWTMADGAPKIAGITAWMTLTPHKIIEAGDHELALCNVTHMEVTDDPLEPVIFHGGSYRVLGPHVTS